MTLKNNTTLNIYGIQHELIDSRIHRQKLQRSILVSVSRATKSTF